MPKLSEKQLAIESLTNEMCNCSMCPLSETRIQVVPGRGNPDSPLVLIGEGPGKQEDWKGVPFIGRSGEFLEDQVSSLHMIADDFYITNTVRCRSCKIAGGVVKDVPPSLEATVRCKSWLDKELDIIKPKVILCLGGPASLAVLGTKKPVSDLRGRWYTDNLYVPAIARVAYHPAYILRLEGAEYDERCDEFFEDIRQCVEEARKLMR